MTEFKLCPNRTVLHMNQFYRVRGYSPPFKQKGAVTLLTSVVILMLATILVIAVSRTTIMEQRISSNEIRARQAFEAAEAGLNFGIAYVTQTMQGGVTVPSGTDKNKDLTIDTIALTTITASTKNKYSVAFFNPTESLANISCPDEPDEVVCKLPNGSPCLPVPIKYLRTPRIVACGWSDDGLGRSMVSQRVETVPAMARSPTNPMTAKGAINVTGSTSVTNYYNNLTIWSGGSLSVTGAAGKTFVRNPIVTPPAASVTPPLHGTQCASSANYVCATDKNSTGPDVIDADPTLSNLTAAQMFYNYFGVADVAAYQASIASMPAVAPGTNLDGIKQESFVVSGSITSNMSNTIIGSRDQPVVMIIDGDWTGGGNTIIYGVVYVRGDVDLSGGITVQGSVIVEKSMFGTGNLDVIFDQLVMDNIGLGGGVGKSALIPGSWRDWK